MESRGAIVVAMVAAIVCGVLMGCGGAPAGGGGSAAGGGPDVGPTGVRFLGGDAADGFARAETPRPFAFPRDHGSHDEFRSEWWYFTGNLDGADGSHYGFEVTFFRFALAPRPAERASAFGTNQAWMAHFAITDVAGRRFTAAERFARGGQLGLAGAEGEPFRVWVKDWSVSGRADGSGADLALVAADGGNRLDLRLRALKPPVAQGDGGLDAKGPEPGNASYYYSFPRLSVAGALAVGGEDVAVSGSAWIDREWGTSALSAGVEGWDWFALQLSDGRDLMYYRLRDTNGEATPFSGGALIGTSGEATRLGADDVRLAVTREWRSARTGVTYPVAWRIDLPKQNLALEVEPYLEDQEVDLSVRYWEGAVRIREVGGGSDLRGSGYLELAGY